MLNTKYKWNTTYGWRTSQGPTDANQPITFTYTATGRLASYGDTTRSLTATYSYDAAGQRTRSVVTQSGTTTTTDYRYDGITLLGFVATQGSASWRIDYLYDENGSLYGGVYRDPATSTTPTVFGMVTTDRGDVVELLDTNGAAFAAYRYDAWGNPTSTVTQATGLINSTLAANIATRQLLRYAGYAYDAESGLYYCSARSYDPATRQWISKDPRKADGEGSAYQYCAGEPVDKTDPAGTYAWRSAEKWTRCSCDRGYMAATWTWQYNGSRVRYCGVQNVYGDTTFFGWLQGYRWRGWRPIYRYYSQSQYAFYAQIEGLLRARHYIAWPEHKPPYYGDAIIVASRYMHTRFDMFGNGNYSAASWVNVGLHFDPA